MDNATCGTADSVFADTATISLGDNIVTGTVYPLTYSYTYYDPRVAALEAKVETLEKMLAALLSGRETPKPRRKPR